MCTYPCTHIHVMHVNVYLHIHITCTHMYAHRDTHTHIYLHDTQMCAHTYTYTCILRLDTHIHIHTCHAHKHTCLHACPYIHARDTRSHAPCIHTCVHTCTRIHACTHTPSQHQHLAQWRPPCLPRGWPSALPVGDSGWRRSLALQDGTLPQPLTLLSPQSQPVLEGVPLRSGQRSVGSCLPRNAPPPPPPSSLTVGRA